MSTSAKPENSKPERKRQDWLIVFLILLLGFACVLVAGQYALRFAPSWQLGTNMESNIDLNSEFLTSRPVGFFEPLDPAILTQPSWVNGNVFLTPGAANSFVNNSTPLPTSSLGTVVPTVIGTTAVPTNTGVVTNTTVPTNTFVWIPIPATKTSKPDEPVNTATNTSPPPVVNADLQVVQVVEVPSTITYAAGTTLTYQVIVTNNGPAAVTGAQVTANLPVPQISTWNWACTPAVASCDGMNAAAPFNDIVNLPSGATIVYTVTATIPAGVSGNLTVTVSITPPAGTTDAIANNSLSDTNTPGVDLVISKIPGAANYTPGVGFSYTITVTNNSTFALNGVTVTDVFSNLLTGPSWSCGPVSICTSSGSGNINDTINMPAGPGSVATYIVSGTMHPDAWGALENTAYVVAPPGFTETYSVDNNAVTSTDRAGGSDLNIGPQDGFYITLGPPFPTSMIMYISPAIIADGTGNYDFVFYERLATPDRVDFDWVEVWISPDNISWYQVFNWGDGVDGNTSADGLCPGEIDNCPIDRTNLYNNTGVAIDIDAIPGISAGTQYPWIMIVSPASPGGDGSDIDSIQPYYP